jgi:hypothetical protein
LDIHTRRQKQQALMTELIERKIRMHAQRLYEQRGQEDRTALEDWVEAESRVLENSILAPLYRKTRAQDGRPTEHCAESQDQELAVSDSAGS